MFDTLKEMIERYRSGEHNGRSKPAQQAMYAEASRLLLKFILMSGVPEHVAEDLVQNKILRLMEHLLNDDVRIDVLPSYFKRTAHNTAVDYFRRKKNLRENFTEPDVMDSYLQPDRSLMERIEQSDMKQRRKNKLKIIRKAIDLPELPKRYRQILKAHYIEGVSIETLTDRELERNPLNKHGTVRSRRSVRNSVDKLLQRARDRVRKVAMVEEQAVEGEDT